MTDEIIPADPGDDEEGWARPSEDPEHRGVEAYRSDDPHWPWSLHVNAVAHVADEGDLDQRLQRALRGLTGVKKVVHEDSEVWLISGNPDGQALVGVAAAVVDELASEVADLPEVHP